MALLNIYVIMNVLAVGAHGDDLEIGCGGALAKHVDNGDKVTGVVVCESDYQDYEGEQVREVKEGSREEKNAAAELGIDHINLGYKTKSVKFGENLVEDLNRIIDRLDIELVYCHWLYDSHQDHIRTARSTIAASRFVPNILMYEAFYSSQGWYESFQPQYYVDISDYIHTKISALKKHKTEINKYGPKFVEGVKAQSKARGHSRGLDYAEAFQVVRMVDFKKGIGE
jgi:LmbE family N-acetylglucosaminyl deacetylase